MVTVHREAGLRFVIFTDDHEPAHVHVLGDGHAKINLSGADGLPELATNDRLKSGDLRKAMRVVREQQAMLLKFWSEHHD
jgi:histidinol phosphatase-like PHP family hydrolase